MPRDRGHELAACPTETLRGHRVTRDPSGGIAPLEAVLARHRQPVVAHQSVDVRDRAPADQGDRAPGRATQDRKSTRLNSSHSQISYAVFCLKKKRLLTRGLLAQMRTAKSHHLSLSTPMACG